jgi:hypothetical protein
MLHSKHFTKNKNIAFTPILKNKTMLHPHHLFDEIGGGTVHPTDYILIKKGGLYSSVLRSVNLNELINWRYTSSASVWICQLQHMKQDLDTTVPPGAEASHSFGLGQYPFRLCNELDT